jgi:hypothetical protein
MVQGILFILTASFEGSHPRVPFVVTSKAIARARDTECGIAARETGL